MGQKFAKGFLLIGILVISLFPSNGLPQAKDFPKKPIEIVCSFAAGGICDLNVRMLTVGADKHLGQPLIQIIKPGAAGAVGTTYVAGVTPDGYTLLSAGWGELIVAPNIGKVSYSYKSFGYIARTLTKPFTLIVRNDSPLQDIHEFIQHAKKEAGKLNYGSTRSAGFITAEQFHEEVKINLKLVPFSGFAPAVTALLGGHIDCAWVNTPAAEAMAKGGKIRMLVVTGTKRDKDYPNVPCAKELGFNVPFVHWYTVAAPRDLSPALLTFYRNAFENLLKDPAVVAVADKMNLGLDYMPGPEFEKYLPQEDELTRKLAMKFNLAPK